jgi:hypothetical protein
MKAQKLCKALFPVPKNFRRLLALVFFYILYYTYNSGEKNYSIYLNESRNNIVNAEWIINRNVMQYSSFMLVDNTVSVVQMEYLVLFNDVHWYLYYYYNVRCLAIYKPSQKLYIYRVDRIARTEFMDIDDKKRYLWKIRCKSDINFDSLSTDWRLALVDQNDFDLHDSSASNEKLNSNYVIFQVPRVYDISKSKKPAIVHCIHWLRDLNQVRLAQFLNWLSIQKQIGVDTVRVYSPNMNTETKDKIYEQFSKDFIQIVHYPVDYELVCAKHILNHQTQPNNALYKQLHVECRNAFEQYFNLTRAYTSNAHERINTNDCYTHFQHDYEYVTNYDVDELIMPRTHKTRDTTIRVECNQSFSNYSVQIKQIRLYDYVHMLFQKYTKSSTASLFFEHVLFISNLSVTIEPENGNILVKTNDGFGEEIVQLTPGSDKAHFEQFRAFSILDKSVCLAGKLNVGIPQNNLKRLYGAMVSNRERGKSVYNTDLVDSMNQHFLVNKKKWLGITGRVDVPSNLGFVSHFRVNTHELFERKSIASDDFFIDYEYFRFISKLWKI